MRRAFFQWVAEEMCFLLKNLPGAQLFGPYQQRKQLQDQIIQLEHQLLPLEQAQEQWRLQQQP
jgi:hypothetical protein